MMSPPTWPCDWSKQPLNPTILWNVDGPAITWGDLSSESNVLYSLFISPTLVWHLSKIEDAPQPCHFLRILAGPLIRGCGTSFWENKLQIMLYRAETTPPNFTLLYPPSIFNICPDVSSQTVKFSWNRVHAQQQRTKEDSDTLLHPAEFSQTHICMRWTLLWLNELWSLSPMNGQHTQLLILALFTV